MSVGDWTISALKERFDDLRSSDQRAIDAAFVASEKRLADARHAAERAEDQASATRIYTEQKNNEFRGQLADQANTFMPRAEADSRTAAIQRQIDDLRTTLQKGLDEVRRLVWIGVGLAIAASIAIPLLLRTH